MTLSSDAEVDATDATEGGAATTTAAILLPSRDDNDDDNDDDDEVEEEEDADDSVAQDNDENNDNDNDEASVIGHEEHPHDPPDTDEIVSDEDSHNNNDETTSTPLLPPKPKPVQRARLAYSIFCDENRSNIQAENPDMETELVAAELNKIWRELSEDEQRVYREKADVEQEEVAHKRVEYNAALQAWKAAGGVLQEENDKDVDVDTSNAPPQAPTKPVKKAATAYFLFASDKRPHLREEHPGASVAVIAKEIGKLWNALSEDDKRPYQEKAAEERERVAQELKVWETEFQEYEAQLKAWKAAGGRGDGGGDQEEETNALVISSQNLIFPMARIKKIAKLDPEVRGISKDALLLITKCAELATTKLGTETVRVARAQNRRKLLPEDVALVCSSREQFVFLKDDIKDLLREMLPGKTDKLDLGKTAAQHRVDANSEAAAGSKRLASYFGGDAEGAENSVAAERVSKKEKKDQGNETNVAKKNVEAAKGSKPLTSYFGAGVNKKT